MPFFESGDAASKEELVKRVSKLLTPNETCLLAMEVRWEGFPVFLGNGDTFADACTGDGEGWGG